MNNKKNIQTIKCDLAIIGAGLTGMAAALFSANRRLSTVQISSSSLLSYSSGLFDILGCYPIATQTRIDDPWKGIAQIQKDRTGHPYTKIPIEMIQTSFEEITGFLKNAELPYQHLPNKNCDILTPIGTFKPTGIVPSSMWNGIEAYKTKSSCLLIGFEKLREFSVHQIAAKLHKRWSTVRAKDIIFPEIAHLRELHPEFIARSLDSPQCQDHFIKAVKKIKKDEAYIGLPAVLGIHHTESLINKLEQETNAKVFEIPTLPVSVPGLRLKETFEQSLAKKGVNHLKQHVVSDVSYDRDQGFILDVDNEYRVVADGLILASGRFISKGLKADRYEIKESIFNLPVYQPTNRKQWHNKDFFDVKGHKINLAGLETNNNFEVIGPDKNTVFPNLYACGSILAHHDWMRMKSGSGVAISTAYAAVQSFLKSINR